MQTAIKGVNVEWTEAIWALWHTHVDRADPKFFTDAIVHANYFEPRPYQDEYAQGDQKEGFTFLTASGKVYQKVINGAGGEFLVFPQRKPAHLPASGELGYRRPPR